MHRIKKLPDANQVSAGSTSTFQVPLGPTYRGFYLNYKRNGVAATVGQMITDIEKVRIKINGIQYFDVSGANWIAILKRYATPISVGVFPIVLTRRYARLIAGEENTCWGTANLETLTIEVDIKSGVTNPSLTLDAELTPVRRDLGPIVKVLTHSYNTSVSGEQEISNLPRSNGSLMGLHLFSANITNVNVQLDSVDYFDGTLETANAMYQETGRVNQAGLVTVEPTYLNRLDDAWQLAGLQDFRVKLNLSAAGNVPIVMETSDVLNLPKVEG